ncbi:uncharacterized protein EDB93DRAFT_1102292 [Suillus bovinus]|uniref:uncharacterized protein n=1 Tax=Suillus bovinus TaxID=48563 RepID=UPI001B87B2D1|nr:uncharacterized protein EDB93DRAFT_1102292 [Suillus bovinus]KAG2154128.1 hypothetical protein EDB93DRAFT_1102292 [Suillus bovinus]
MDLLGGGMQRLAPTLKKHVGIAVLSTEGPEDSDEDIYWEAFGDRELDGLTGVLVDTSVKQEKITSTHAPQKVIETLLGMGICVSVDSIKTAITSHHCQRRLTMVFLLWDLKSTVHTVDKSEDTLKHLTAGLLFPLQHGITLNDLHCSKALWERLLLNTQVDSMNMTTKKGWKDLLTLHPDPLNETSLSQQDHFNSWKILSDLIEYGPTYFHQFKDCLGHLESVEMIPIAKTKILASHAMDISNSTVSGNINLVLELLKQGDIEDLAEHDPLQRLDVSEYAHSSAQLDENTLMRDVGVLRPKETASELFEDLLVMANVITKEYVADHRLWRMRSKDVTQCDGQYENALLLNKHMLLYKGLSYAMNIGDIRQVEMCIVAWILIFKATGKHKYVMHMSDFLSNVHFVYPDDLW